MRAAISPIPAGAVRRSLVRSIAAAVARLCRALRRRIVGPHRGAPDPRRRALLGLAARPGRRHAAPRGSRDARSARGPGLRPGAAGAGLGAAAAIGGLVAAPRAAAFIFTGGPVYDAGTNLSAMQKLSSLVSQLGQALSLYQLASSLTSSVSSRTPAALASGVAGFASSSVAGAASDVSGLLTRPGTAVGDAVVGPALRAAEPLSLLGAGTGQSLLLAGTQPSLAGLDAVPDAAMCASPADARIYSRETFALEDGGLDLAARRRLGDRRRIEADNALLDAHGVALSQAQAAAQSGQRARALQEAVGAATTLAEQKRATAMAAMALLEEWAGIRALAAAQLRVMSSSRLAAQSAVDRAPPTVSPASP